MKITVTLVSNGTQFSIRNEILELTSHHASSFTGVDTIMFGSDVVALLGCLDGFIDVIIPAIVLSCGDGCEVGGNIISEEIEVCVIDGISVRSTGLDEGD